MPKIIATKEDWIKLGYQLFAEKGIAGIVIEAMAKKLKVNKSSFYWHFKTKKQFIEAIIAHWILTDTNQIIALTNTKKSGKKQLEKLIELAFKKDPYLDFNFFLKRYALKDKKIQAAIDQIDQQRIAYTQNILVEMNYTKNEAEIKAILLYKYLIGYHEMIRYKKQSKNYLTEVKKEINQFIKY